ncbi:hypothetical protein BU15DRAFT_69673, partial [Melanogaster broomeanus]
MSTLENGALHQSKLEKQAVSNPDAKQTSSSHGITTRPASHLRLQFYGFPLSRIWLMDYARKCAPTENLARADEVDLVFYGVRCLRAFSGISYLGIGEARFDPRKVSVPDDCLSEPGVVQVSVLPVWSRLKKILGREEESPRWWEDVYDPR